MATITKLNTLGYWIRSGRFKVISVVVAMLTILACGGLGGGGGGSDPEVKVTLTASSLSVKAGETVTLAASVEGSADQRILFAVNAGKILTDDGQGNATWKAPAAARDVLIRATSAATPSASASATIAVGTGGGGSVTLKLTASNLTTTTSRTISLDAVVEGSPDKHVNYACNSGQFILDDGLGHAIWKAGIVAAEATIRATSVANKAISSTAKIQVQDLSLHVPLSTDYSLADVGQEVVVYSSHTFTGHRRVLVGEPSIGVPNGFVEAAIVETSPTNTRFVVPTGTPAGRRTPIRLFDGDTEVGIVGITIGPSGVLTESEYNDDSMFSDNPLELHAVRGDSDSNYHSAGDVDIFTFCRIYHHMTGVTMSLQPVRYEVTVTGAGNATIDSIPLDAQRKGIFTLPLRPRYGLFLGYESWWSFTVRGTAGPYEIRFRGLID